MTSINSADGLKISKIAGSLGARIDGLDLAQPVDDAAMDLLKQALGQHSVLLFPNQLHITPQQHVIFARRWGDVSIAPMNVPHVAEAPEVLKLHIKPGAEPLTDQWHSDLPFLDKPPMASLLLARMIPPAGGDTMWASGNRAYDALSNELRRLLRTMRAVHSGEAYAANVGADVSKAPKKSHPVIRTVQPANRNTLFLNEKFTSHFDGMTIEESRPLLKYLTDMMTQPNFTFRHKWTAGDLIMWDNRCVAHYAIWDYSDERLMHRVTVEGETPVFDSAVP